MTATQTSFYVTGGTLELNARSYVQRQADDDLFEGLMAGRFCYVLTPRQMGKSSLMVRTVARLRAADVSVVVLDLTKIGQNLSAEQWYDGLLTVIGQQLDIADELDNFWLKHARLGPMQCWMRAVREFVLERIDSHLVIFVDEIDYVRSLPFSTDEFFAGIREFYNRRSEDPELERLTFCLLGVATPSDLIRDTRTTPFNIGTRIEVTDFDEAEASPLIQGLHRGKATGARLLKRILYWTGGHPYLTQRLCQSVAEETDVTDAAGVDRKCEELFLSARARERDNNLLFVRERLLRSEEADRPSLLDLYQRVRNGKRVPDDETNLLVSVLRLSGITRTVGGLLRVRNRIYHLAFDKVWIMANMPDAEARRQRAAYRKGLQRTAAFSLIIILLLTSLIGAVIIQRDRADESAQLNRRLLYVASIKLAQQAWENGNISRLLELLRNQLPKPGEEDLRGFEWYYLQRLASSGSITLDEHSDDIQSLDFSLDGQRIVTGSDDKTARIWDANTGQEILSLSGHTASVWSVAFSSDGQRVVTGSVDKTGKVWNANTGQEIFSLLGHTKSITGVAFSPDDKRIVTTSEDKTAKVWDANTGTEIFTLRGHSRSIIDADFSPDGQRIVTCSDDKTAKLWDANTGQEIRSLTGHSKSVNSAHFSPDGQRIVTGSTDKTAKVWNATTGHELFALRGHTGAIFHVNFSPDGQQIVTNSDDKAAKIWNANTGQKILSLEKQAQPIWAVLLLPNGRNIAISNEGSTIKIWDVVPKHQTLTPRYESLALKGHTNSVFNVAYSPDGHRIVTGSADSTAKVWDADTGEALFTFTGHTAAIWSVAFSPDGKRILTSSEDRTAKVWDANTFQEIFTFKGHISSVFAAAFSPDGQRIITGSGDATARVWDANTGKETLILEGHKDAVYGVAFSPDGQRIVTSGADETARVWRSSTGAEILTLKGHTGTVVGVDFSPDGKRIVTGSDDQTGKVWDALTGQELFTLQGVTSHVYRVAFSPDGSRIASSSKDKTAKVWDAVTGRETLTLKGHTGLVNSVSFSPDGKHIVTGSDDGTARVWDAGPFGRSANAR